MKLAESLGQASKVEEYRQRFAERERELEEAALFLESLLDEIAPMPDPARQPVGRRAAAVVRSFPHWAASLGAQAWIPIPAPARGDASTTSAAYPFRTWLSENGEWACHVRARDVGSEVMLEGKDPLADRVLIELLFSLPGRAATARLFVPLLTQEGRPSGRIHWQEENIAAASRLQVKPVIPNVLGSEDLPLLQTCINASDETTLIAWRSWFIDNGSALSEPVRTALEARLR